MKDASLRWGHSDVSPTFFGDVNMCRPQEQPEEPQ